MFSKNNFFTFLCVFILSSSISHGLPACKSGYIKNNCISNEIWTNSKGDYIGESTNIKVHGYLYNNIFDGEKTYTYKNRNVIRGQSKNGKFVLQNTSNEYNKYAQNSQRFYDQKRTYIDPRKDNSNRNSNKRSTNNNLTRLADYIGFLIQCYKNRQGYRSVYITRIELNQAIKKANYLIQNSSLPGNKNELIKKFHKLTVPEAIAIFNQSLGALMFMNSNFNPEMRQECQNMNFAVKMSKSLSDFK